LPEELRSERSARILVVDDDHILARMFMDILEATGHACEIARSGPEALDLVRTKRVDLIISDLRMPMMGGQELWERLLPDHPELAASMIFVSAEQPEAASCKFLRDSGHVFLRKPFSIPDLLALIEKTMARDAARRCLCA